MQGVFSNGQTLPIAQLAVASFNNPAGLSREGQNYFSLTAQSGIPLLGTADSGGRGTIQQGTLESSNVDVALEYTNLITAQRGFQVNTRTITASDQMLQDLANIQ
jgi:flagellar hook protein FlgE